MTQTTVPYYLEDWYNGTHNHNKCWWILYPILLIMGALVSRIAGTNGVWTLSFFLALLHAPGCLVCFPLCAPVVAVHLVLVLALLQLGRLLFGGSEPDLVLMLDDGKIEEEVFHTVNGPVETLWNGEEFVQGMLVGILSLLAFILVCAWSAGKK